MQSGRCESYRPPTCARLGKAPAGSVDRFASPDRFFLSNSACIQEATARCSLDLATSPDRFFLSNSIMTCKPQSDWGAAQPRYFNRLVLSNSARVAAHAFRKRAQARVAGCVLRLAAAKPNGDGIR